MLHRVLLVAAVSLALAAAPARAGTIHVPADAATIQAALDAALQNDVIVINADVYLEAVAASLPPNVVIKARGNVRIDASGLGTAFAVTGTNLKVIGLKVIGASGDGFAIGGLNATFRRCKANNVVGRGFVVGGTNATLERCPVIDAGGDGLSIDSDCLNTHAFRTAIRRPLGDGVINAGHNVTVEDLRINKPVGNGIVDDASGAGTGNQYQFNRIVKAVGSGMILDGTATQAESNRIVKAGQTGIDVTGNTLVIRNNRVRESVGNAVHVGGNNGVYTGNRSVRSAANGFVLDGSGNTLSLNKAKGSAGFDLLDNNVGANVIAPDNVFGTTSP